MRVEPATVLSRPPDVVGLLQRLEQLTAMSGHQLRAEWSQLFRAEPSAGLSRDLLIRGIAYKLQERALGGLSQASKRMFTGLAAQTSCEGASGALDLGPALAPGVRLVRDWGGRAHTVIVLESGFEYQGERYRSLTEIARRITGAHWSGPRFFGVARGRGGGTPSARRHRDHPSDRAAHGQV